ncbi:MAG: hypothetical protein KME31_01030 [Tolypothrix carrinoi HA7290-LM1]|jgi:hypothetical protein|nr:hypothetical protein [Tolypothrix carrinoi HA7290-LM1]
MNPEIGIYKQKREYVKNSTLILIAFVTAFFPRIINAVGVPAPINFVHFVVVPLVCGIVIFKTKVKDKKQIAIAKTLLSGLMIMLVVMTASALLNQTGVINIFVGFMLIAEPYIFLLTIICVPFTLESLKRFRAWMLGFASIHIFLALSQKFLLDLGVLTNPRLTKEDNIQGVFYLSGGGHVVSAYVSMSFSLYYFFSAKTAPLWIRACVVFTAFFQLLAADAKQVLLIWIIAWVILILSRVKDIKVTLQYVIAGILIGYILFWCIENLEAFKAYKTWIRPEIYGPNGDATVLKTGPFRIIPSYYQSSLNWFLGLGPGHTIGRLGGWMLVDYWNLLGPLGASVHPASLAVWATWRGYYLDSSLFSPFWGWAGIWGDSGFLGLAAYLYIFFIVFCRLCVDDFSKFMMLTVLVNGFIFTLMEEPGYMLTVATLIGLRWHEQQITMRSHHQRKYMVTDTNSRL